MPVRPHFLMELHLPPCCAVPNSHWREFIPQLNLIVIEPIRIVAGQAIPSDGPGLAIAWDWPAIDRFAVHHSHHP